MKKTVLLASLFLAAGGLFAQTDSQLNGAWVSAAEFGIELEFRFDGRSFEQLVIRAPAQKQMLPPVARFPLLP